MKYWYEKIDEGIIPTRQQLVKKFYSEFYMWFASMCILVLLFCLSLVINHVFVVALLVMDLGFFLLNDSFMRNTKNLYWELYGKKKKRVRK